MQTEDIVKIIHKNQQVLNSRIIDVNKELDSRIGKVLKTQNKIVNRLFWIVLLILGLIAGESGLIDIILELVFLI